MTTHSKALEEAGERLIAATCAMTQALLAFDKAAHAAARFDDSAYAGFWWALWRKIQSDANEALGRPSVRLVDSQEPDPLREAAEKIELTVLRGAARFLRGSDFSGMSLKTQMKFMLWQTVAERGVALGGIGPLRAAMAADEQRDANERREGAAGNKPMPG